MQPVPAYAYSGTPAPAPEAVLCMQAMPRSAAAGSDGYYERYRHRKSIGLGISQILMGFMCFVLNAVGLWFTNLTGILLIGHGFWSGAWFIVTGSLGIAAGRRKTRCQIIGFMVTCIISACCSAPLLALGIIGVIVYPCGYVCGSSYDTVSYQVTLAMHVLLAILGFIDGVLSIWGSAICCRAVCCGAPQVLMIPANYFPNNQNQGMTSPYVYYQPPSPSTGSFYEPGFVPPSWNQPDSTPVIPSAPTLERSYPPAYPGSSSERLYPPLYSPATPDNPAKYNYM